MARFLSSNELYPMIREGSAKTRNILWVCSPYIGYGAHEIFSQKIIETPPNDIRFIFRLSTQSVRRGEVNPYEIEYLSEHSRNGAIRTNDSFHAKVYIFDDSALVTSANLSKSAFERNIEAGVLLEGKQIEKAKTFYEKLWKNSRPTKKLDEYKTIWNKSKVKFGTQESFSPGKGVFPHSRINSWIENESNRWLIQVTERLSEKTEAEIREATGWSSDLEWVSDINRIPYRSLRLGDIAYLYEHIGKVGKKADIQQVRIKDKRELATREGRYHFTYEVIKIVKANKEDFSLLLKRMCLSDREEVKLSVKQSRQLEQFMLRKKQSALPKDEGLVEAIRHVLSSGQHSERTLCFEFSNGSSRLGIELFQFLFLGKT